MPNRYDFRDVLSPEVRLRLYFADEFLSSICYEWPPNTELRVDSHHLYTDLRFVRIAFLAAPFDPGLVEMDAGVQFHATGIDSTDA